MSVYVAQQHRGTGIARFIRGWIVAFIAVLLAAGGHQVAHSVMHGATETLPIELLGFSIALTAPVAVALAGQRLSTWSTAATTIFGQLAFHLLYSLPYAGGHSTHAAHAHHATHTTMAADVVMMLAHTLAAAMTTWVVVHGEHSLVALLQTLTLASVRKVLATPQVWAPQMAPVLPMGRVWIPHPMNVTQSRSTRGPPVLA